MANDIHIVVSIMAFFILLGTFLPFVQAEFNATETAYSGESIISADDLGDAGSDVSAFDVIASILKMFFWTFGTLPTWLDTLFIILRITLVLTVARNIWVGGGG